MTRSTKMHSWFDTLHGVLEQRKLTLRNGLFISEWFRCKLKQ